MGYSPRDRKESDTAKRLHSTSFFRKKNTFKRDKTAVLYETQSSNLEIKVLVHINKKIM